MFWWIVATLIAFFVKGLCGFANTLIFTSMLSFVTSNANIAPVELILGYPSNIILMWKERKSIKWNICLPLVALVITGIIPGALFLKNANVEIIKIIFGFVIILISLEMLVREYTDNNKKESKFLLGAIGFIAGLLCGLYGIGALIGAYVNRVTKDSSEFKANVCVVFAVEATIRVFLYSLWGIITLSTIKKSLMLMPLMFVGLVLGIASGKYLDEKVIKKLVIILLMLSGVALIINSVR